MSREIEIKRKLKIRIPNGKILSYNFIQHVFNNIFKCNIFNSDIKIGFGNGIPGIYMKLNCNINRQESTDLLLTEFANYFSDYNVKKYQGYNDILLESIVYERQKDKKIDKFCEIENKKEPDENNWLSVFVNDKEFDLFKIQLLLESKYEEKISKIEYAEIDNFKKFTFKTDSGKKFILDYEDFGG